MSKKKLIKNILLACTFFLIPFITWLIYLLAFWPGLMSFDSAYQWKQILTFQFSDWHPVFHTFLMWLITRIRFTPAVVTFTQIVFFSMCVAYGLFSFRRLGVPIWLLLVVDILFSFSILNSFMAITIWKDIPYSLAILVLCVVLIRFITSQGNWINYPVNIVFLGGITALIALFRHNGPPVGFGTLILLLVFYPKLWKRVGVAFALALIFLLGSRGLLYNFMDIKEKRSLPMAIVLVHPIAAYVSSDYPLSIQESKLLERIFPLENGWEYNCYDASEFFYKGVNFAPVREQPQQLLSILTHMVRSNPKVVLNHFVCLSSFVWQLRQTDGIYLETIILGNLDVSNNTSLAIVEPYVRERSKLPEIKQNIKVWAERLLKSDDGMIFWRPAIYIYSLIIAVLLMVFRKRNFHYILILVPIFIQSAIMMFTTTLQALRYMYPVYIVSGLFVIPLMYLAIKPSFSRMGLSKKELRNSE